MSIIVKFFRIVGYEFICMVQLLRPDYHVPGRFNSGKLLKWKSFTLN